MASKIRLFFLCLPGVFFILYLNVLNVLKMFCGLQMIPVFFSLRLVLVGVILQFWFYG